jgi:AcrR family transcriptional regulator
MVQKMKTDSIERVEARREVGKRVRRESILAAAERVVIARGYAEASMDQVAREAGMAAGTLYLYFPGKEALLQELLGSKVRRLDEAVGEEIFTRWKCR